MFVFNNDLVRWLKTNDSAVSAITFFAFQQEASCLIVFIVLNDLSRILQLKRVAPFINYSSIPNDVAHTLSIIVFSYANQPGKAKQ